MNYVTGLMFSADRKKIILITKLNPDWQRGLLNGIGGKIEPGESPVAAICREFTEETGVITVPVQWTNFAIINHLDEYHVTFFVTFDDTMFTAKTTEKEVVGLYDVDDLPPNLVVNLRWLIPLALDTGLRFDMPAVFQEIVVPGAR